MGAPRIVGALIASAALLGGCTTDVRVTDPARTATEQFLLSEAAAEAVSKLSFQALRGRSVYVEDAFFGGAESAFVLGQLRAAMLRAGVAVADKRTEAEIVLEVRSHGVGIDRNNLLVGLPALALSQTTEDGSGTEIPFQTPELSLVKNIEQQGVASVAFVAYWRDTGELVASSGPFTGETYRSDWWILGFGPRTSGDIAPTNLER